MSKSNSTSSTPFTVFDYLGLAFLLVPPGVIVEALMKGETLTLTMFIYAVPAVLIGAVCIYIGRHWDTLKTNTKSSIVSAIDYLSGSYVVLFLIFVLFLGGIAISPILLFPPSHNTAQAETQTFPTGPITTLIGVALLLFIGAVIGVTQSSKLQALTSRNKHLVSADSDVLDIHTCRIEAHTNAILNELYIDFIITAYNGEDVPLTINSSVSGTISIDNISGTILSPPIIINHHNLSQISTKSELTFVIRQYLPSATAATFHNAISGGNTLMFGFRSLVISIARNDRPAVAYRLPLWDGVSLVRGTAASKIVYLGQPQVAAFPIITGRLNVQSDG